jgi:hypothetical protein
VTETPLWQCRAPQGGKYSSRVLAERDVRAARSGGQAGQRSRGSVGRHPRGRSLRPARLRIQLATAFELPDGTPRQYRPASRRRGAEQGPALTLRAHEPRADEPAPFEVPVLEEEPRAEYRRVKSCVAKHLERLFNSGSPAFCRSNVRKLPQPTGHTRDPHGLSPILGSLTIDLVTRDDRGASSASSPFCPAYRLRRDEQILDLPA